MIILRQKEFVSQGRMNVALTKLKNIKQTPEGRRWGRGHWVKTEKFKRKAVNAAVEAANNPVSAALDLSSEVLRHPVSDTLMVAPVPGGIAAGVGVRTVGNKIKEKVNILRKIDEGIDNVLTKTKIPREIKKRGFGFKKPYKVRQ